MSSRQWTYGLGALCTPPITLEPCIPHEHHSIGDIERFNRTLGDTINKKLYGKPHLTKQYWGYAYMDCVMKHNMCGSIHGPDFTPFELWHGHKPDLLTMPMIPFGSIVMAHVPLKQQDTHGDRAILNYAVGTALCHKCAMGGFDTV